MKRICRHCGNTFEADRHHRKFCSLKCNGASRHAAAGGMVLRTCELCGKEFKTRACRVARGGGKFCSFGCSAAVAGKKMNRAYCQKYRATWASNGGTPPQPMPAAPPASSSAEAMLEQILGALRRPAEAQLDPPRPIEPLLDEFRELLTARGNSPLHVSMTHSHCLRLIRLAEVSLITELTAQKIQLALGWLPAKYSAEYRRAHFRSIRGFVRHLVEIGVYARNPMAGVKIPRPGDPVYPRRAMTDDEVTRFLEATAAGPPRYGMWPAERLLLYQFALGTGIRSGEIRELRVCDLSLDPPRPYCTVRASVAKSGKLAKQPMAPWLADKLRAFVQGRAPDARLFSMPHPTSVICMFRGDLRKARIDWIDESPDREEKQRRIESGFLAFRDREGKYLHFHGLRHTYITRLARVCNPAVAQKLARHSTVELTMKVYTHIDEADTFGAVDKLPSPVAAVGTGG